MKRNEDEEDQFNNEDNNLSTKANQGIIKSIILYQIWCKCYLNDDLLCHLLIKYFGLGKYIK